MPYAPTEKQLDYAKKIALKRKEPLPTNADVDAKICRAYIAAHKNDVTAKVKQPTDKQKAYAKRIYTGMPGTISEREYQVALTGADKCSSFIQRYEDTFKEIEVLAECRKKLNSLDVIPASLRQAIKRAPSAKDKKAVLDTYVGKGYSGVNPASLHTVPEKLTAYWLEGLQCTAFEGMGKLENVLGNNPNVDFNFEHLQRELATAPCKDLRHNDEQAPVRHIILREPFDDRFLYFGQWDEELYVLDVGRQQYCAIEFVGKPIWIEFHDDVEMFEFMLKRAWG